MLEALARFKRQAFGNIEMSCVPSPLEHRGEEGQIEPVSSSALGAYLFGAMLIVLASAHADLALIAFTLLIAATLFVAWRAPAATGALGAAAATVFIVFA